MSERSDDECMEILRGLGYTEQQIAAHAGLPGGLNAWVDHEVSEAEESLKANDPAAYAAEMSRPYEPPHIEALSVDFRDPGSAVAVLIVLELATLTEAELRGMLDDYGASASPVDVTERVEPRGDGTQTHVVSVITSGDESTLDLVHDNVLDVLGPRLRERLNSAGLQRIRVAVEFSSLLDWF